MTFKGPFQPNTFYFVLVWFIILGEKDVGRKGGGIK